jgi:hypothetical protein
LYFLISQLGIYVTRHFTYQFIILFHLRFKLIYWGISPLIIFFFILYLLIFGWRLPYWTLVYNFRLGVYNICYIFLGFFCWLFILFYLSTFGLLRIDNHYYIFQFVLYEVHTDSLFFCWLFFLFHLSIYFIWGWPNLTTQVASLPN